jgi:hypothetical protein
VIHILSLSICNSFYYHIRVKSVEILKKSNTKGMSFRQIEYEYKFETLLKDKPLNVFLPSPVTYHDHL